MPIIQIPQEIPTKITRFAFLTRFTDEEAIMIDLASMGATPEAAAIRRYMSKVDAAISIDLTREDLRTGLKILEDSGLIGVGRADEILNTPIRDDEL